jgi:hypothetical protein
LKDDPGNGVLPMAEVHVKCPTLTEALSRFRMRDDMGHNQAAQAVDARQGGVQEFLARHPHLLPLLPDIADRVHDYFPGSSLFLSVASDPEELDREQLAVTIATSLAPNDAVDRLEEFDYGWWLDNLSRAQGKVCVDVEFA